MALEANSAYYWNLWPDRSLTTNAPTFGTAFNDIIVGSTLSSDFYSGNGEFLFSLEGDVLGGRLAEFEVDLEFPFSIDGTADYESQLGFSFSVDASLLVGNVAETGPESFFAFANYLDIDGVAAAGALGTAGALEFSFDLEAFAGFNTDIQLSFGLEAEGLAGNIGTLAQQLDALALSGTVTGPSNEFNGAFNLDSLTLSATALAGSVGVFEAILPPIALAGVSSEVGGVASATFEIPFITLSADGFTVSVIGSGLLEIPLFVTGSLSGPDTDGDAAPDADTIGGESLAAGQAMVLNTRTMGLTLYDNFPFNSMARFLGQYVALSADGIYALGGETDAGDEIDAVMTMGVTEGEVNANKRIAQAFVAYSATGPLELRVRTDDNDWYAYQLNETKPTGTYRNRVKFGKGIRGNFYQFEVRNLAGKQFSLESIELPVEPLTRKTS